MIVNGYGYVPVKYSNLSIPKAMGTVLMNCESLMPTPGANEKITVCHTVSWVEPVSLIHISSGKGVYGLL